MKVANEGTFNPRNTEINAQIHNDLEILLGDYHINEI